MIDLLIIGGGPAGYVAAERAGHAGLKVVLFEKKAMGGVCLNEGCIPTKTLLYSAKMYENALHGDKYGVFGDNIRFDYEKIISRKKKVVRKLVSGVESKMKSNHVTVVKGEALIEGRSAEGIEVTCNGEKYSGKNLLICTGSEASVPPIPGLQEAGEVILTNREILEMTERPASLVVIGGGVIGMEFASFYNSLGTKVTVVEMLPEILGGLDFEVSAMLRDIYTKKGITFNLNAKVVQIADNKVVFEKEGETHSVEGEKILLSVGRRPVTKGFGLENLGVELLRNGIKVDEKMRTNIPGVFAAGDVTGFSLLAHTASREGEVVVNNLTGRNDIMRYNAIPGVVYTNPEVAGVGETEESAKAKGIAYKVAKLPMAYAGRFVAENEGGSGICKVLVGEKHGEVIGVHLLGNPSSEIIYGACIAIEQEMTLKEMQEVVFPHPTVSEILKETVFSF
ncbi:MAG: dihydrolipoyl dehydrogenase [Bacteroidetes bacterium GWD2_45_23]|nr:MAG: dihydrolipoyl dehydrogenase [Bacteroidetes bacterium GWC2_46_850]OFX73031.1 MAG: dihydrolipoyl dehydrogenase [Bacteroidetes bacterium GWC1_47_7]OFX85614.1 MAG: dihydrolipoyl dehydrogenase [Bacteroidetes bacterium GWD2_45_23]HAR39642.1 dihydrolipoyl dehydrogenase [Porphyromonadaceae bacterium]HBB00851.1 dihydrolipoyl dehydrogenase [Porphyromonadaceae bacterium]